MPWYDPAFSFKKSFIVSHSNVSGGSDLLDFPLLLSFTDSALKSMDNGGLVASSSGYDFLVTDGTETRELPYEVESYTASSGALVCWVRVPVLSASQDTLLYLYFGNGTVTGFQAQASNVWDKNYQAVWHLGNGSTLSTTDSSVHSLNGTNHSVTATTGQIGGGASLNGSSSFIQIPNTSLLNSQSIVTLSGWINTSSTSVLLLFSSWDGTYGYQIWITGTGHPLGWSDGGGNFPIPGVVVHDGVWHYLVATWDGTNGTLYVDGSQVSQAARTITASTKDCQIGTECTGSNSTTCDAFFGGIIDEVRVSKVVRSASWIATEYANQNSPSSFVWIGETIPYAGNVDEALIVASSVTTAQSSLSQINVDSKGAIVTINVTVLGAGETFTLAVKGKDGATGQAYTIASFPGIGLGTSAFTVYPGIHASSTAASAVLPHVWYVTVTPSTSDTASYTVGASLLS